MSKLFTTPFAKSGDKVLVPDAIDVNGDVSYTEGFNFNFERNVATDPLAKPINRQKLNQLLNDITDSLGDLQIAVLSSVVTTGAFSTAGTPFVATPAKPIAALASLMVPVTFNAAGGSAPTINVSGLGAKNLKQYSGSGSKVPAVIVANMFTYVFYDGTDFVVLDQLPGAQSAAIAGSAKNLAASSTGLNANVAVSADELIVEDSGNNYTTLRALSLTINSASAGANGLDTGSLAASTWYSVWVIYNPTTATSAGLLSLSSTTPTMPAGYTAKARVGWIRTDSTANKYPLSFVQYGRRTQYKVAAGSNVVALPQMASGVSSGAVATSAFVPPTASEIALSLIGNIAVSSGGGVGPSSAYSYGNGGNAPLSVFNANSNGITVNQYGVIVLESTNVYYSSSSANLILQCAGWIDNI